MDSLTLIRWLKKITFSFWVSLLSGSVILTLILNLMISLSSPIDMSSEMWKRKKNLPRRRWLSITYVLIDSMTTASICGCLKRKFSNSTLRWAVKGNRNTHRLSKERVKIRLTKWEKLLVMVDSFARVCCLLDCCMFEMSHLCCLRWIVVKDIVTTFVRIYHRIYLIWILGIVDVDRFWDGVFVIVSGLDTWDDWLLFWHMVTVTLGGRNQRLTFKTLTHRLLCLLTNGSSLPNCCLAIFVDSVLQ